MNFRLLLCIAMGVFVTYIGVVMLIAQFRRQPYVPPPKPNFTARSTMVVDPKTGERKFLSEAEYPKELAEAKRSVAANCK